ncbi:MAG: DUF2911 domain-containing protein [Myxococcales bacterium]|nr:DUF2911 domain-containing protein [Myxococcales bacterium]
MTRFVTALVAVASLTACPTQAPPDTPAPDADPPAEAPAPAPEAAPAAMTIPERKDDAERKSKNGHLVGKVGDADLDVRFGRPEMRGRTLWGELVPYGQVWRTGADEASTFAVTKDVTVEGKALAAGVYGLFTIPGESEWTVIFNSEAEQWGGYSYDESKDVLRVTVTPGTDEATEAFDIQQNDDGIVLRWGNVAVPVKIAATAE